MVCVSVGIFVCNFSAGEDCWFRIAIVGGSGGILYIRVCGLATALAYVGVCGLATALVYVVVGVDGFVDGEEFGLV